MIDKNRIYNLTERELMDLIYAYNDENSEQHYWGDLYEAYMKGRESMQHEVYAYLDALRILPPDTPFTVEKCVKILQNLSLPDAKEQANAR